MNDLYIISEVLYDYTPGMAVIAAPSLDTCREIFAELSIKLVWSPTQFELWVDEFDSAITDGDYKVIEGVDHQTGVVSYVVGGG